jgi:predicted metal-binding membrane protein
MTRHERDSARRPAPGALALILRLPAWSIALAALSLAAWAFLAWIVVDMGHPFAQLTMPASARWTLPNVLAILAMWAVMMAAMMLPSALPMVLTFVSMGRRGGDAARGRSFVAAYLAVWFAFSAVATLAQWALQRIDWVDPMVVSTSPLLTGLLLLIAGVYQFSRLKRICLSRCQSPFGFLLGAWRPGVSGAFVMGARHGLYCLGCCWALMALLFVGGVMNLAWIAALSIAVALEKLLPGGERIATVLGIALVVVGCIRLVAVAG